MKKIDLKKKNSATGKFTDWLTQASKEFGSCIFNPPLEPQLGIDFLCEYLLGEDWYDASGETHPHQVNTQIVHEILYKYSRKYRNEYKRYLKGDKNK